MLESCNTARSSRIAFVVIVLLTASICGAQPAASPAPAAPTVIPSSPAALPSSLDALAWLRGCWIGSVNRREFLEQWSPPRGGMMVGFSHTVVAPKFQGTIKEKMDAAGKLTADP